MLAAGKSCGPNISVTKLECVGHVQKINGARLGDLLKKRKE
jgi:hypothetical protein